MGEIQPGQAVLALRRESSGGFVEWRETVPLAPVLFVPACVRYIETTDGRFHRASIMFDGPYRRPTVGLAARRAVAAKYPGDVLFTVENVIDTSGQAVIAGYFVFAKVPLSYDLGPRLEWYSWRYPETGAV